MFQSTLKWVFGVIGLFVMLSFGMRFYEHWQLNRIARPHLIGHTRLELRNVAAAVGVYCEIERRNLTDLSEGMVSIRGEDLYRMLSTSDAAMDIIRPKYASEARKAFLDGWEREIHAKIRVLNDQQHIVLWSDGPNREDNDAQVDDVVVELDVPVNRDLNKTGGVPTNQ